MLLFPSSGDLPDPGIEPTSPELAGGFFTTEPPGKPTFMSTLSFIRYFHIKLNLFDKYLVPSLFIGITELFQIYLLLMFNKSL